MAYMKAAMSINAASAKVKEDKQLKVEQTIEWLNTLLDYAEGKKKWDTGGAWVCEGHPRLPHEQGLLIDCQCGAPGMPPIRPCDTREEE